MKKVYQTDEAGYFVGSAIADSDPLAQDNFLIPAGCVEFAPPEILAGKRARLVGREWQIEDVPVPDPAPAHFPEVLQDAATVQFKNYITAQIHDVYSEFSYEAWEFEVVVNAAALHLTGVASNLIESEASEFGLTADKFARRIVELREMQQTLMLNAVSLKRAFMKEVKANSGKAEIDQLLQEQRDLLKEAVTKVKDKKPVSNPNKPVALKA